MSEPDISTRTPHDTLEEFFRYWAVQDVDMAMSTVAEHAVWHLHLPDTTVPFGGASVGREAIRADFFAILKDWDYLRFEPHVMADSADTARFRLDFTYHYRRTGEDLIGSCRGIVKVIAGLIVRIDEYHDAALIEAFMRLANSKP